jgi:hypothetical protein
MREALVRTRLPGAQVVVSLKCLALLALNQTKSACQFRRLRPSFVGAIASALPRLEIHAERVPAHPTGLSTAGTALRKWTRDRDNKGVIG